MELAQCGIGQGQKRGRMGGATWGGWAWAYRNNLRSNNWIILGLELQLAYRQFRIIHKVQMLGHKYNKSSSYSSTRRVKHYSYSPLDSIGKGFSSVVYRGLNDNTKQVVAIKAIDMRGIRDSAAREMLECEIEAISTLKHANIMKCYEVIKEPSCCYIMTEFCNGGDLSGLLKKKGRISESETLKILRDIVKGYVEIGQNGFLHRDLKLANVLMNNGEAKIADFGFAKKCSSQSMKERYNVGSPLYMPPEALKNNIYSNKSDIWSIGIMAFEMLHGDTPWQCKTERQLIDKMQRIPVKFRDSLQLSDNIKNFIKKCLDINQSKRMNLSGLKEWLQSSNTSSQDISNRNNENREDTENLGVQRPSLVHKPTTFDRLENRPLSELTNRMSLNNMKGKSINSKPLVKNQNVNNTNVMAPKAQADLSKSKISKNNNIVIKEIIMFRLYFKTLQKLKEGQQVPEKLKNILGNETIRRVTMLKKLVCSSDLAANQQYSLEEIDSYLNPIYNPEIKKYKSVVDEYFKRYTNEIKMEVLDTNASPSALIKDYLCTSGPELIKKDALLAHWLLNLTEVSAKDSKSKLESVIEPRAQPSAELLSQHMRRVIAA